MDRYSQIMLTMIAVVLIVIAGLLVVITLTTSTTADGTFGVQLRLDQLLKR